jgi:hypothetical protein
MKPGDGASHTLSSSDLDATAHPDPNTAQTADADAHGRPTTRPQPFSDGSACVKSAWRRH